MKQSYRIYNTSVMKSMHLGVSAVSAFATSLLQKSTIKFSNRIVNRYTVTLGIVGFHAPTLSTEITVLIFFLAFNNICSF